MAFNTTRLILPQWQLIMGILVEGDFSSKVMRRLAELCYKNPGKVGAMTGSTYSSVVNNIHLLRKHGYVTMQPEGRVMTLRLTDKGRQTKEYCMRLMMDIGLDPKVEPAKPKMLEDMPVTETKTVSEIQQNRGNLDQEVGKDAETIDANPVRQRKVSGNGKFPKSE